MTRCNLIDSDSFSETHLSTYPAPNRGQSGRRGNWGRDGDGRLVQYAAILVAYDMKIRTG